MSLNWWATWLIVIANSVLAYHTVQFLGLEDTAPEYYIEKNVIPYYTLMAGFELLTMRLISNFKLTFITPALLLILFTMGLSHTSALVINCLWPYSQLAILYTDVWYSAIIETTTALQVFVFGISFHFDDRFPVDSERVV